MTHTSPTPTTSATTSALFRPHLRRNYVRPLEMARRETLINDVKNPQGIVMRKMMLYVTAAHIHNEIATDRVVEALAKLKAEKTLYRHNIKKQVRKVEAEMQRYNVSVWAALTRDEEDGQQYVDVLDEQVSAYSDKMRMKLNTFLVSVKQGLDDKKRPHSAMLAEMEVADDLLSAAVLFCENDRNDPDVRLLMQRISLMDLGVLSRLFRTLSEMVLARLAIDKSELQTTRGLDAWKVLCRHMCDYETYIMPLIADKRNE